MSEPLRIACPSIEEIPAVDEIARLATDQHHVVLVFSQSAETKITSSDKSRVIEKLADQLPENYSVFDSGGTSESTWVTITKVISEREVIENVALFIDVINEFCATGHELTTRLAQALDFPVDEISETWSLRLEPSLLKGNLDDSWEYRFHGHECRFRNLLTKQVVDVRLQDFGNRLALLDPFFLGMFVRTSPNQAHVANLLKDDYHNTARVLRILSEKGYLR